MFLCTCVFKIDNFVHNTYTKFCHMGFVNSYVAVTSNCIISSQLDEAKKMTMHLGFVNFYKTNFDCLQCALGYQHPLFLLKPPPLKSANCPSPLFQSIPPLYCFFHETQPLLNVRFFCEAGRYESLKVLNSKLKFPSLNSDDKNFFV